MGEKDLVQHYINGNPTSSHETFANYNPATGEVSAQVCLAGKEEVDAAVAHAKEAFTSWAKTPGAERAKILHRTAALLRENNAHLAKLEVEDTGKPIQEADCVDILSGADAIDYYAGVAPTLHGHHYDLGSAFAYTRREPLGVVCGIGAWNYPIQIACWKSAPALACGNTMVFKPSELTPVTAVKLAEIYREAGLPKGVFNVIQGDGRTGKLLSEHKDVAKVSLTGEVETGKLVMAQAAKTLKAVTMELGGKSPLIVFDDAQCDEAVKASMMANFYTQGEICSNGTRVFVHRKLMDEFTEKVVARANRMTIGNPQDSSTQVGALISAEHKEKVLSYIASGKEQGAKLLCGGDEPVHLKNTPWAKGNFVSPTVFSECTDDMKIVKEEIFGPVMSVLAFDNEEEVVRRANATPYGLAAGVFTRDIQKAHRVVAALEAGTCWINNYNITPIEMPFGGYKQSGIGRENSLTTIEHYTQLKSVYVEMNEVECPYS